MNKVVFIAYVLILSGMCLAQVKLEITAELSDQSGATLQHLEHKKPYQNVLWVTVTSKKTGEPCPGAKVTLNLAGANNLLTIPGDQGHIAKTNSEGVCSFDITAGNLGDAKSAIANLKISASVRGRDGHADWQIEIKKPKLQDQSKLDVKLVDWDFLIPGHKYDNVLRAHVKNKAGKSAKDIEVKVEVSGPDTGLLGRRQSLSGKTGKNGEVLFDLTTESLPIFKGEVKSILKVSAKLEHKTLTKNLGVSIKVPETVNQPKAVKVLPSITPYTYRPNNYYPNALEVHILDSKNNSLKDVIVRVSAPETGKKIYVGGRDRFGDGTEPAAREAEQTTNNAGIAYFSLKPVHSVSGGDEEIPLTVSVVSKSYKGETKITIKVKPDHSWSDRIASEIFIGQVFQPTYDADGEIEGFDETSDITRFRIDSLWGKGSRWAVHFGGEISFFEYLSGTPTPMDSDAASDIVDALNPIDSMNSMDPVDPMEPIETTDPELQFTPAFSYMFYLNYQFPGWTKYTKTSNTPGLRYDAWRFGLELKGGVINRDRISPEIDNFDTHLRTAEIGINLREYQTRFSSPEKDFKNTLPVKFFDASIGYFEEFAGQEDELRVVINAGIRLFNIAGDTLPIYAGSYLNAGEGPDDLRVYIGTLFDISKIRDIFQDDD